MPKLLQITIIIDGECRETPKAYGIPVDDRFEWIPKSLTEEFKDLGEMVSFWIPEWLIKEKGLEDYIDTSYMPSLFEMK